MSKLLFACLTVLTVFISEAALANTRTALVIANGAYSGSLGALPNPVNDGKVVAAALEQVGFSVTLVTDADQEEMKKAIKGFGKTLELGGEGAVGLFYYAGHGMQIRGVNYLVPVGAEIEREEDADLEAVQAESVLKQMEFAGNSTNIVILDACRNNPLARSVGSAGEGLARMDAPTGSFVAYSTAPGNLAIDGSGSNSPFAQALSTEIQSPNLSIEEVFRRVRVKVKSETADRQVPWDSSSLTSAFTFNPSGGEAQVAAEMAPRIEVAEAQVGKTSVDRSGQKQTSDSTATAKTDAVQIASLDRQLRPRADILDAISATPLFRGFPKPQNYRADIKYLFSEPNHSLTETLELTALSDNLAAINRKSVEVKTWNGVPKAYRLEENEDKVVIGPLALTHMSTDIVTNAQGTSEVESAGRISAVHETDGYLFPMKSGAWIDVTYAFEEPGGQPRDVNVFAEVVDSLPCEKVYAKLTGRCFSVELTTRLVQRTETSYRNMVFVEDLAAFIPWGEFGSGDVAEGKAEIVSIEPKQ